MARLGRFDMSGLKEFQSKLQKINQAEVDAFLEDCARELAGRLLRMVKKRTPVGDYGEESGKKGGTLRCGWTVGQIRHQDGQYTVEIINPVEYASYVEYGHRTVNHKGWVPGKFMMTMSEKDLQDMAPKVLENKIKKFLGGILS